MTDKPIKPRFSLRALFIVTAFVGIGLLSLKYPTETTYLLSQTAQVFAIGYGVALAIACTGRRRLSGAVLAVCVFSLMSARSSLHNGLIVHNGLNVNLWDSIHPGVERYDMSDPFSAGTDSYVRFKAILLVLFNICTSAIAAYTIPWLVQRGQKPE